MKDWNSYLALVAILFVVSCSEKVSEPKLIEVGQGWARNSVNTTVFRKNSLYTYRDHQYVAYYDDQSHLVVGKRESGSEAWELNTTDFTGNTQDAHNSISLIVDGEGYLHVSWDHHNSKLRYIRSLAPETLEFSEEQPMIGEKEEVVSYPEFYAMSDGSLLFFYRDGGSGNGNLIINSYSTQSQQWSRLQDNLISGEGQRNAYWQACTGDDGSIHISWVWRESPDVASNHDMSYAKSVDGGRTWTDSKGKVYDLPITESSAEVISFIPQNSELINQTSMTVDPKGEPLIASYWTPSGSVVPQFHVICRLNGQWQTRNTEFRNQSFSLSGGGTKAIPIARPQILATDQKAILIFRDAERASRISLAIATGPEYSSWQLLDLTQQAYSAWEPTLDPSLWIEKQELNLFVQDVVQVDGEGIAEVEASTVQVLEWKP